MISTSFWQMHSWNQKTTSEMVRLTCDGIDVHYWTDTQQTLTYRVCDCSSLWRSEQPDWLQMKSSTWFKCNSDTRSNRNLGGLQIYSLWKVKLDYYSALSIWSSSTFWLDRKGNLHRKIENKWPVKIKKSSHNGDNVLLNQRSSHQVINQIIPYKMTKPQ